jgi:predicted transcriptional regulator of viral defense system
MATRKSINQYKHTLSETEARILSSLSYAGKTIFTIKDIKEFTDNPKNLLDWLVRKRWILKIKKGVYLIAPLEAGEFGAANYTVHSFIIASVLVEPYYIAYWSALNHHGLTDQTPPAIYVATTKPRNSRTIFNTQFKFVAIPPRKMFGIEETEIEKRKIKISTPEKTIVDCLDHPEHCGGTEEIAKAVYFAKDEIDQTKLVNFAQKIGNTAVLKRLGYISETLKIEKLTNLLSSAKLATGYSLLDPTAKRQGRIVEKWRILVNVQVDPSRWTT